MSSGNRITQADEAAAHKHWAESVLNDAVTSDVERAAARRVLALADALAGFVSEREKVLAKLKLCRSDFSVADAERDSAKSELATVRKRLEAAHSGGSAE